MNLRDRLILAVTAYDRRASKSKSYNPYALGQYFMRIDDILADVDNGADPRAAIMAGFSGRLVGHCLKACGLRPVTDDEEQCGSTCYRPVIG